MYLQDKHSETESSFSSLVEEVFFVEEFPDMSWYLSKHTPNIPVRFQTKTRLKNKAVK